MKVLFVSSEIFPFAKSGGLADVASSLPKALASYVDIVSIMPLYSLVDLDRYGIKSSGFTYSFIVNGIEYTFEVFHLKNTIFLKDKNTLFDREQMYGDYSDNDIRFGIFCYAVLEYVKAVDLKVDIFHLNDWQSALIALLLKEKYKFNSKTIFTIHNLAYQGVFSKESMSRLDLGWDLFKVSKIEYYDKINFLKSAINYSDVITTVSPTYAQEIQSSKFGCNLENLIEDNEYKLKGILNGIDYSEFNPSIDKYLSKNFDEYDLSNKALIKRELLEELCLYGERKPLFVFIGRFTAQKGIDQIIDSLDELSSMDINIAILGSGEEHYNYKLGSISGIYENLSITIGYNESLARRLYAAADFLYMPSQYEPCGLNQMIAMKYGSVPIVRSVGGLKDSIKDIEDSVNIQSDVGIGIIVADESKESFIDASKRAVGLFYDEPEFKLILWHNMRADFSWDIKAKEYLKLYTDLYNGWLPKRKIKEFEIPNSYNIDTLKSIAVNRSTVYTYWEYQGDIQNLVILLYSDGEVVDSGKVYNRVGNYYFYGEFDFKEIWTEIGFYDGGEFIRVLKSNIFIAPNAKIINSQNIVWRDIITQKIDKKEMMVLNEVFYEKRDQHSSSTLFRREKLRELILDLKDKNQSSIELIKRGDRDV